MEKTEKIIQAHKDAFEKFYEIHKNATLNLTAIKSREDFYVKHYMDSLWIFAEAEFKFETLADIGSGGGFPGIPLAIMYPERKFTLIESIRKKCEFLQKAIAELKLNNVDVINKRAEDIVGEKFDIITARGVTDVKKLIQYTSGMSTEKTIRVLYKGEKLTGELDAAKKVIKKKNLEVRNVRIEDPFQRTYSIIGSGSVINDYRLHTPADNGNAPD